MLLMVNNPLLEPIKLIFCLSTSKSSKSLLLMAKLCSTGSFIYRPKLRAFIPNDLAKEDDKPTLYVHLF